MKNVLMVSLASIGMLFSQELELSENKVLEKPSAQTHIKEFYKNIHDDEQEFTVKVGLDAFIECEEGTLIFIPKNTFVTSGEEVVLHVKEHVKKSDLFLQAYEENLSLDSGYEIHESLYIRAYDKLGNRVYIKKGNTLGVMIPTEKINSKIEVIPGNVEVDVKGQLHHLSHFRMIDFVEFDRHGHLDFSKRSFSWIKRKQHKKAKVTDVVQEVLAVGDSVVFADVHLESIQKSSSSILRKAFEVYNIESAKELSHQHKKPLLRQLRVAYPDLKKLKLSHEDIEHHEYLVRNGKKIRYDKIHYYLLDTDAQGWLLMGEENKVKHARNVKVNVKPFVNVDVKLVSESNNMVVAPTVMNEDYYEFHNIPSHEKYSIIGVKLVEDGSLERATTTVKNNVNSYNLKFEKTTEEELKGILSVADKL